MIGDFEGARLGYADGIDDDVALGTIEGTEVVVSVGNAVGESEIDGATDGDTVGNIPVITDGLFAMYWIGSKLVYVFWNSSWTTIPKPKDPDCTTYVD